MGIRSKVLLAFLLCFGLVGWASLVLLKQRMNAEFETLERADLVESMGRVLKVMDASAKALNSQTRDWSEWTDMYTYFGQPAARRAWAESNMDAQALDTADISFVDLFDARGGDLRQVRSHWHARRFYRAGAFAPVTSCKNCPSQTLWRSVGCYPRRVPRRWPVPHA